MSVSDSRARRMIETIESPIGTLATRLLIWALGAVVLMGVWVYMDDRQEQRVFKRDLAITMESINKYLGDARVERAQITGSTITLQENQKKLSDFMSSRIIPKLDNVAADVQNLNVRVTGLERDVSNIEKKKQ